MSNLNFANMGGNVAPINHAQAPAQQRPKAKVWANLGKTFHLPDGNGGTEPVFVSVFGFPVDTMEDFAPYTGKNERMRHISEAKTLMLKMFQDAGGATNPGEGISVAGLETELRRVGEAQASASGANPMLEQIAGTLKFGA